MLECFVCQVWCGDTIVKKENKKLILLGVHTEIHQGVEGRVGHGEPEEGEEDVLSIAVAHHILRIKYEKNHSYSGVIR